MSRHVAYLKEAAKIAEQSSFRIRMGALVVRQRRVIGVGCNALKSHPICNKPGNFFKCIHAEIAACLDGPRDLSGSIVYVARILKNNELALAKPCEQCDELLVRFRVRRAYYTVNEKSFGEIRYGQGLGRYI